MTVKLEQYFAVAFGIGLLILLRYLGWKSMRYPTFINFIIFIVFVMIILIEYKKFI